MSECYFDQKELARRWSMSPRTLERWRLIGFGPKFLKLGKKVKYRAEDIKAFEQDQLRQSTAAGSLSYSSSDATVSAR